MSAASRACLRRAGNLKCRGLGRPRTTIPGNTAVSSIKVDTAVVDSLFTIAVYFRLEYAYQRSTGAARETDGQRPHITEKRGPGGCTPGAPRPRQPHPVKSWPTRTGGSLCAPSTRCLLLRPP